MAPACPPEAQAVLLLRGVNVGQARRVPMALWRETLLALGARRARTLLNSGNAVVSAPASAALWRPGAVAGALQAALGLEVPVQLWSEPAFRAAVAAMPWPDQVADPARLLLSFAPDEAAWQQLQALALLVRPGERWAPGPGVGYLQLGGPLLDSAAAQALLGPAHRRCTNRNWSTVTKLLAMLDR